VSNEKNAGGEQPSWYVFDGPGTIAERLVRLGSPPLWRQFKTRRQHIAKAYRIGPEAKRAVNAALYLRRPLLVTGPPGSGKSSLAEAVASNLQLGRVLRWPINSRSTLAEGLYGYDVIARLRDAEVGARHRAGAAPGPAGGDDPEDLGPYIRLNALGTALYSNPVAKDAAPRPRVLLIDEIDKSDIDLPNDLLNVLEEGEFEIPELARVAARKGKVAVEVETADLVGDESPRPPEGDARAECERRKVLVRHGIVSCEVFPFVVITSNGERDLPPAFLRRCLQLDITPADNFDQLKELVEAHLNAATADEAVAALIRQFRDRRNAHKLLANDQLLNAVFLILAGRIPDAGERAGVVELVLRELNQ
jgi:MoxR-like ATPase